MKNIFKTLKVFVLVSVMLIGAQQLACANYPSTLDNGNLVLVSARQGVGRYADRSSVQVARYAPPNYQISIRAVNVTFSDNYFREHHTYVGGPYSIGSSWILQYRYNWNAKSIATFSNGKWVDYDVCRSHSTAEGYPLIQNTAEVAFVSAYNMRFFDDKRGYDNERIISESLYHALNI